MSEMTMPALRTVIHGVEGAVESSVILHGLLLDAHFDGQARYRFRDKTYRCRVLCDELVEMTPDTPTMIVRHYRVVEIIQE